MAREDEITLIRNANRAAAVGQLMLGEFKDWQQFLKADVDDLETLPRRALKSGKVDIRKRLSKEIKSFCEQNFENMDHRKLTKLYGEIKTHRGLELSLVDFAERYAKIRKRVLVHYPAHCTVSISLWGLKFKAPEEIISKDIVYAFGQLRVFDERLKTFKNKSHESLVRSKEEISDIIRAHDAYARMCLLSCFNLVEAYLNGLAWGFAQGVDRMARLSEKDRGLIEDGKFIDKLRRYPKIIAGGDLWSRNGKLFNDFLQDVKPFRDSLVHASPFSCPNRYGGYDKLSYLYRIDGDLAWRAVETSTELLAVIFKHVAGRDAPVPHWLDELSDRTAPT